MRAHRQPHSPRTGGQDQRRGASNAGQCKPACTIAVAAGIPPRLWTLPAFTGTGAAPRDRAPRFSYPATLLMGKYQPQLHHWLFAMETAARPQAVPPDHGQAALPWVSTEPASELHLARKAAAPATGQLLEATSHPHFQAMLRKGRHAALPPSPTCTPVTRGDHGSSNFVAPVTCTGKRCRCKEMQPEG